MFGRPTVFVFIFYGMQGNRESTKLPSVQFFETNKPFGNMSLKHLYHHSKLSYTVIVLKKTICCLKLFDQDITTDFEMLLSYIENF